MAKRKEEKQANMNLAIMLKIYWTTRGEKINNANKKTIQV